MVWFLTRVSCFRYHYNGLPMAGDLSLFTMASPHLEGPPAYRRCSMSINEWTVKVPVQRLRLCCKKWAPSSQTQFSKKRVACLLEVQSKIFTKTKKKEEGKKMFLNCIDCLCDWNNWAEYLLKEDWLLRLLGAKSTACNPRGHPLRVPQGWRWWPLPSYLLINERWMKDQTSERSKTTDLSNDKEWK